MRGRSRLAAIGGVAGPASFITAWAVLGARAKHYSPIHDPISRLAAVGAPTRAEMTTGMLAFVIGAACYAVSAREHLSPRVGALAAVNAAATLGVAAMPLEGFGGQFGHMAAAATAYASLAAMPAVSDVRGGRALAAAIGAALILSGLDDAHTGFFQRAGLTLGDVFIVGTSLWILRGKQSIASRA